MNIRRLLAEKKWPLIAVCALLFLVGNFILFKYLLREAPLERVQREPLLREKSAPGIIPPHREPVEEQKAPWRVAIVIDDLGYRPDFAEKLGALDPRITLSILPGLPHSREIQDRAAIRAQEVILHMPMEPLDKKLYAAGEAMLRLDMSAGLLREKVRRQLDALPAALGVNNHMGSLFTSDKRAMTVVLKELKKRRLFFLDSLTGPHSLAYETALELGLPALKRDVFLDNEADREYITGQLELLVSEAREKGRAVAIGHPHPETLSALRDFLPSIKERGGEVVKLSALLERER